MSSACCGITHVITQILFNVKPKLLITVIDVMSRVDLLLLAVIIC